MASNILLLLILIFAISFMIGGNRAVKWLFSPIITLGGCLIRAFVFLLFALLCLSFLVGKW